MVVQASKPENGCPKQLSSQEWNVESRSGKVIDDIFNTTCIRRSG